MKPQSDRISRACDLIRSGCTLDAENRILSISGYRYTVDGCKCTCPDAWPNKDGVRRICKHVWATTGRPAAIAIDYFRSALDFHTLRLHGLSFAPFARLLPPTIVEIARHEYRLARRRIEAGESEVAA